MPATEQTWYDQKLLHVVFGFAGLFMLLATVWMFGADHDREWKGYQRKFRAAEQQLTQWRIDDQNTAANLAESQEIESQLADALLTPPSPELYAAFKSETNFDAQRREKGEVDFTKIDAEFAELQKISDEALRSREEMTAAQANAQRGWEAVGAAQVAADEAAGSDKAAKKAAKKALKEANSAYKKLEKELAAAKDAADEKVADVSDARKSIFDALTKIINQARGREDDLLSQRKFKSADLDKAKADLGILVRDGASQDAMIAAQAVIDEVKTADGGLEDLTLQRQAATAHRKSLQQTLAAMSAEEDALAIRLTESRAEYDRLNGSLVERRVTYFTGSFPFLGKKWLELPILDAFNSPLKIDNLWTDGLTITQGSFGEVKRYDRCTTCHKGIEKAAPGSSVEPAYVPAMEIDLVLQTPDSAPTPVNPDTGLTLEEVYGIRLADRGLVDDDDVTVSFVQPLSAAAMAHAVVSEGHPSASPGFQVGDVLLFVNNDKVLEPEEASQYLIDGATWGEPTTVTVRRGMPQPFTSHPRLDLYVGSMSPHKMSVFACTACHEGQGSATEFAYASHMPDSTEQATDWATEHGWFDNHHWINPMFPKRFAEAACLRCHHEVTELQPSERFAEAPAPKVVRGHELIKDYGCFGCHEVNGYDGPDDRIGPDLRLEPNYFAAAQTVKADAGFAELDPSVQAWTSSLIEQPYRDGIRHKLATYLQDDAASETPQLTSRSHSMATLLADQEAPGSMRRVGPSLRYVKDKLGAEFLNDWIREPKNFRPSTKMPQFFGLWDHLDEPDRQLAEDYEQVEIQSITNYLLQNSEPFEYTEPVSGAEPASAERGKVAFEIRGCLACHMHDEFPEITAAQGPNLTGIGDKLSSDVGAPNSEAWLYTWLKNPTNYHARTKMPDLLLNPEENAEGQLIDPAADITAYLLASKKNWIPDVVSNTPYDSKALDALSMEYLNAAFPRREAVEYLQSGIPQEMASSLKGAEIELVGGASESQKLLYIGRKSIAKYGCYGCHDIPGFENAKPIGAALADWGRKESSKLAFEHIAEYLHHGHGGGGHGGGGHGDASHDDHAAGDHAIGDHADDHAADHESGSMAGMMSGPESDADVDFFQSQIGAHNRTGFIWQKLREPRSYDYKKTANKGYNERLRMPMFPFGGEEREAVITFVLGLVATPPAEQFVYAGDPRNQAISEGLAVLEKYNCAGCHVLRPEMWSVEFASGDITAPQSPPDFPFLDVETSKEVLESSANADRFRGFFKAHLVGMPAVSNDDGMPEIWDEDWEPIDPDELEEYSSEELVYPIQLWKPATVEGKVMDVGARVAVPATAIKSRLPAHGGDLANYLLSRVTELEKQDNPNANATESWGWVPPPLIGEGSKVQPGWLHNFLLDPYKIRPAVFLRMPKFNMSPDEATKLVNYFAAVDSVDYPFEYDPRMAPNHLADSESAFEGTGGENRLDHAMKIVTNGNYCVKCHLVGDFMPEGSVRALAPDLSVVQSRLRPDYMRRWIANPSKVLPYSPMPINIVYNPDDPHLGGVEQQLYPGTSVEQLDGVVDLLSHYGEYMSQKNDIGELVKKAAAAAPPAANEAAPGQAEPGDDEQAGAAQDDSQEAESATR